MVVERRRGDFRGGNSRHTRNLRCAHDAPTPFCTGTYREDEFFADLLRVNGGETDEPLARLAIRRVGDVRRVDGAHGVRFQAALRGTLHLSRTNAFFLGGGKALMNAYYAAAERLGIDVVYDAEVVGLDVDGGALRDRRQVRVRRAPAIVARRRRRGGVRRLRVEPRVAARGVGRRRGRLRRSAARRTTPARLLRLLLDAGARAGRRPARVSRDCRRRARAEVRRRHRDAARLHSARHRRQPARRALRRRGRGPVAQALRELGRADRAQPGPERVFASSTPRWPAAFMPSVFPPIVADSIAELARSWGCRSETLRGDRGRVQRRRPARHASISRRWTTAAPRG